MKIKIIFFILLLIVGVGKIFAESNENSILKALEKRMISSANLDSVPGTSSEKLLAISLEGRWISLKDSIIKKESLSKIGTFCEDLFKVKTAIKYDSRTGFETKSTTIYYAREKETQNTIFGVISLLILYAVLYMFWKSWEWGDTESIIYISTFIGIAIAGISIVNNLYLGIVGFVTLGINIILLKKRKS